MGEQDIKGVPVELGLDDNGNVTHTFGLVQQRHARLLKHLFGKTGVFRSMDEFTDLARQVAPDEPEEGDEPAEDAEERDPSDVAAETFEGLITASEGKLYDLLSVFIPNLMPRWEFEGYGSEGHYERDEYVDELDRSPSVPQINTAFETAVQVNGLRWVKKVLGFFDSKMLRAEANLALQRGFGVMRENMDTILATPGQAKEISPTGSDSPSSPVGNGASASTSSGTTDPTPPEPSESAAVASASPSPDS